MSLSYLFLPGLIIIFSWHHVSDIISLSVSELEVRLFKIFKLFFFHVQQITCQWKIVKTKIVIKKLDLSCFSVPLVSIFCGNWPNKFLKSAFLSFWLSHLLVSVTQSVRDAMWEMKAWRSWGGFSQHVLSG